MEVFFIIFLALVVRCMFKTVLTFSQFKDRDLNVLYQTKGGRRKECGDYVWPYRDVYWGNCYYSDYRDYSPIAWYKVCSGLLNTGTDFVYSVATLQWIWGYPLFLIMQIGGTRIVAIIQEIFCGSLIDALSEILSLIDFWLRLLLTLILFPIKYVANVVGVVYRLRKQRTDEEDIYWSLSIIIYEKTLDWKTIGHDIVSMLPSFVQKEIEKAKERRAERMRIKNQQAWERHELELKKEREAKREARLQADKKRKADAAARKPLGIDQALAESLRAERKKIKQELVAQGLPMKKIRRILREQYTLSI